MHSSVFYVGQKLHFLTHAITKIKITVHDNIIFFIINYQIFIINSKILINEVLTNT